jgi:hypothetical protein
MAVFLGVADYIYASHAFPSIQPASVGNLPERLAWYREHAEDYNLVFIGDSRTYCGMHAELIDPLLKTSSLNLSSFANWFPTQLALAQDLAPLIPKGTTVVWSVGWQNFGGNAGIQRIYPIGPGNALRYLAWGVPSTGMADNLFYYNPALYFLTTRHLARQDFLDFLARPFDSRRISDIGRAQAAPLTPLLSAAEPAKGESSARELAEEYRHLPGVNTVVTDRDGSKIISLTVYFQRGSSYRVELDHDFFRGKQKEYGAATASDLPTSEAPYWRLFEEILAVFKANGVNLVVNEMDEAPFTYAHGPEQRRSFHGYMRDVVGRRVREAGFPYVSVDFEQLSDEDYFDFDHINSRGARKFIPMLADQLRPYVRPYHAATSGLGALE